MDNISERYFDICMQLCNDYTHQLLSTSMIVCCVCDWGNVCVCWKYIKLVKVILRSKVLLVAIVIMYKIKFLNIISFITIICGNTIVVYFIPCLNFPP